MRKIEQLLTTKISEITPHYLRGIRQELEQGSQIDTELLSKLNTYLEQMLSVYANYLDTLKQQEMEYQNQQQKQLCTIYMKESDLKWITDRKNRSA